MSDDNNSCQSDEPLEDELYDYCSSATITEEGIHEIIDRHKESAPDNFLHVSDYEFFHHACRNETVTEGIIQCLLEYFPDAVNDADDDECLPLHYACRNNNELGIIRLLIDAAPDSVRHTKDNHGDTPLHKLCANTELEEKNALQISKLLLEKYPESIRHMNNDGQLPLHYACKNCNVSLGIIELLLDVAPDLVRHEDDNGYVPLHCLCSNTELDDTTRLDILKLLLEKHPESTQHVGAEGHLPIHLAAVFTESPEFCSWLLEAYPGSDRIADNSGMLPFHHACAHNTVEAVEYWYNVYPDAVDHPSTSGLYPVHIAIGVSPDKIQALKIVKFLLDCDPRVKFQEVAQSEQSLLHFACRFDCGQSNTAVSLKMIEAIYDAHPELIRKEDDDGQLLLHQLCAVPPSYDETRRIAILKLLLEKYPESIRHESGKGFLPIHNALMMAESPAICRMLIDAYPGSERIPSNSTRMLPFHYACMNNTLDTVEYLYNLYPDAIEQTASHQESILFIVQSEV